MENGITMKNVFGDRNPNWKGGLYGLICEWCYNSFQVIQSRKNKARFCSIKCANDYQRKHPYPSSPTKNRAPGPPKKKKVLKWCLYCGTMFSVLPSRKYKIFFCNHDCQFKWRSQIHGGSKNPNWRGGVSKEPYTYNWRTIAREIVKRDANKCMNPDCKGTGKRITVHHIDHQKKNNAWLNLITLCEVCNSKANFNRKYWAQFYSTLMFFYIFPWFKFVGVTIDKKTKGWNYEEF